MRVQRYICANCRSFSPIHSSVEDDRRYPRAVTQLATVVDALADSSLENRQDLFTIHYDVRSSSQQIHNWCTEQTAEIVANDFSVYSSIYTHDRQYLTIDEHRAYRLTVYMSYFVHQSTMDSATGGPKRPSVSFSPPSLPRNQFTSSQPTGDQTTQTSSKTISTLHTTTVASTSSKNGKQKFQNTVLKSVRYTNTERLRGAIVWSEFKRVFATQSYGTAVRRFKTVLDKIEYLPKKLRTPVEDMMEAFNTFPEHFRYKAVPSTTNNRSRL